MSDDLTARDRLIALAALVLGAAAIGAAAVFVRLAENEGVGPTASGFWRMALALPFLAVWAQSSARRAPEFEGRALRFAILAGVFFAGDMAFWHLGIVRTTVANATFLPNLAPVVVALAAWAIFREPVTRGVIIGLALAITGAALLSGANVSAAPERLTGDMLCAITALWYAAYMLAIKAARRGFSAARAMFISSLVCAFPLLALALILGEQVFPDRAIGWLWLAGLGVFAHVFGQGGIAYGLGRLPAALSSLVVLVQPVVAAILGWIVFSEALAPAQLLGAALTIAGVVIAQRMAAGRDVAPPPGPIGASGERG